MDELTGKLTQSPDIMTKKRKVDKDGFVRPTTPDRLRSPSQYDSEFSCSEEFDGSFPFPTEENISLSSMEEKETVSTYFQPEKLTVNTNDKTSGHLPTEHGAADQWPQDTGSDIQALMKDFTTDTSHMLTEWGKVFRQTEVYESDCTRKLDLLMKEAQELERNLNSQKHALREGLKRIGETLKNE